MLRIVRLREIVCLLAAGLILALAGCGGGTSPTGEFEPMTPGTLTVLTDSDPSPGFWTTDPPGGFEYELAHELARELGLDRVEIVRESFEQIVGDELQAADVALAQITPTAERERILDFSSPYLTAAPAILARIGTEVPDVKAAQELDWIVQHQTTLADALENEIRSASPAETVETQSDVIDAVASGRAEAALLDLPVALAAAKADPSLAVVAQLPSQEILAVALPLGSNNLEAVNAALRRLHSNGVINGLAQEWIGVSLTDNTFVIDEIPVLRTGR